eukprot:SAG31_NODE_41756_length_274_cov_1.182857_1_plen_26_part_10
MPGAPTAVLDSTEVFSPEKYTASTKP